MVMVRTCMVMPLHSMLHSKFALLNSALRIHGARTNLVGVHTYARSTSRLSRYRPRGKTEPYSAAAAYSAASVSARKAATASAHPKLWPNIWLVVLCDK